jgi:nucleoside-diphosphate-sugar epimerase
MSEVFNKILITGGTGFLGKYLVDQLLELGFYPTIASRNAESFNQPENWTGKVSSVNFDLQQHDNVRKIINETKPTLIVNLAGTHKQPTENANSFQNINFISAVNLFETAMNTGVSRIIQIGTADEYGMQTSPQKETFESKPQSPYSVSKANATAAARRMFSEFGLPVVILRPFTVYGYGQPSQMFFSSLISNALKNSPFQMTEGKQKRDYIYASDVAKAIIAASTADDIEGEIFNIGSGISFPLFQIAKKVWEIAGADPNLLEIGARPAPESELHNTLAEITKAKNLLKWIPTVTFDEGLKKTIDETKRDCFAK